MNGDGEKDASLLRLELERRDASWLWPVGSTNSRGRSPTSVCVTSPVHDSTVTPGFNWPLTVESSSVNETFSTKIHQRVISVLNYISMLINNVAAGSIILALQFVRSMPIRIIIRVRRLLGEKTAKPVAL